MSSKELENQELEKDKLTVEQYKKEISGLKEEIRKIEKEKKKYSDLSAIVESWESGTIQIPGYSKKK